MGNATMDEQARIQARQEVIRRHARLLPNGVPMYCTPSQTEQHVPGARLQGPGTDGKVIYPDLDAAMAAATEFVELGSRAQRPYPCRRSRTGHYHLAEERGRTG